MERKRILAWDTSRESGNAKKAGRVLINEPKRSAKLTGEERFVWQTAHHGQPSALSVVTFIAPPILPPNSLLPWTTIRDVARAHARDSSRNHSSNRNSPGSCLLNSSNGFLIAADGPLYARASPFFSPSTVYTGRKKGIFQLLAHTEQQSLSTYVRTMTLVNIQTAVIF